MGPFQTLVESRASLSESVAQEILQQLGGNKFLAMTGAKQLVGDTRSLQFSLRARGINKMRITLDASDTYTLEGFSYRNLTMKKVWEKSGIYADDLQTVFTQMTGLDTHL